MIKKRSLLLLFFLALGANTIAQTYTEVENNNTIGNALASSQVRKYGPGNFEGTVSSSDSDFWVVSRKSDQATQIKLLVHTNYVGSPGSVDFRVWEYTGGNWGVSGSVVGTLKTSPNPGVFYYEVALNYQNNLNGSGISNNYYALEVFTTSATPINYSIPFNPSTSFPYCYELTIPTVTPTQVNDTDVTLNDLQIDMIDDRYYIVKFSATNSFTDFTDHYIQDQALPTEAATNSYSGSGEHVVYVGTDNGAVQSAMTMANLQRNTTYYYKVYTYSNCQGYINYNNTGTPVAVTTCPGTVPSAGSVNSVSATSPTTATINTLGRPAGADTSIGYLVKFSDTNSFTAPTSGTTIPTASADYSGQTGEQVVYTGAVGSGAGTTDDINQVITGLQINTNYYVKVYTYDLCGGKYNFETTGSAVVTTNYVCAAPSSAVTSVNANATGTTTMDINSFTPPSNTSQGTLAYVVKVSDTDSFTAPSSEPASSSTAYNTGTGGEQVVYVGSSASPNVSITGLAEITTYYVKVYAYNTCAGTDYFETTGSTSVAITTCGTPTGNSELNSFRTNLHWETRVSPIISNVPADVEGQVVKINTENSFTDITGSLNTLPIADVNYSGSGEQVILAGAFPEGQAFTGHNLLPNTQYFFKIYSYKECAGTYYFSNTSDAISTYTAGVTTNLVSNVTINNFIGNAFTLASFSAPAVSVNGNPKGYIVKLNTTNSFTPYSFRGPIPTPDADYKGGEQVVYVGNSTAPNQVITGLTPNTTYYFTIYAYTDSGTPHFLNSYQQVGYEFSVVNSSTLQVPIITFDDVTVNANGSNFDLNATSDSSGAINYRIITNGGTDVSLSGTNNETVTIGSTAGTVTIEAYQEATATHQSASKTMTLTIDNQQATLTGFIFYQVNSGVTTVDMTSSLTSNSTGAYTFEIIGDALGYSVNGNLLNVNNVAGSIIIKVTQAADANYGETVEYFSTLFYNAGFNPKTPLAHNVFNFSLDIGESRTIQNAINISSIPISYSIIDDGGTGSTILGNVFTAGNIPGTVTLRSSSAEDTFYTATTKDVTVTVTGVLPQTITFNSLPAKIYGDTNFDLTATASSGLPVTYVSSNTSVATISGSTVTIIGNGTTTITASQAGNAFYDPAIDVTQDLTVIKRTIEITADAVSKAYGNTDNLTYQITSGSLAGSDTFTGSLARATGEDVGTYAINQGTLALTSNYNLSYVGANLSITAKPIEVTADAGQSKELGAADPIFTYTITNGNLVGSDAFTGVLDRNAGETVGTYPITQGTLALNANYNLSFVSSNFEITKTTASVIINDLAQTYDGTAKPVSVTTTPVGLTVDITYDGGTVVPANAGDYTVVATINDPNYQGSTTETLTINKVDLTVTADAKTKVYGDSDPALTYQITAGTLIGGDAITGTLNRVAGEAVGTHVIQQGTLSAGGNYTITFVSDDFEITQRAIEITADAKNKEYGGVDPALTYQITSGALQFSDAFTGSLTRTAGENVGNYAINQGTLALNNNYALSYIPNNLNISKRAVIVAADNKMKTYGDADPALTYTITVGSIVVGDVFSGELTRVSGENVGNYRINQGTLTLGANYTIIFTPNTLDISQKAIEITADTANKQYGDADPALTYQITAGSLVGSDSFTGSLTRAAGEAVGPYAIGQGTVALNGNYALSYVSNNLTIGQRAIEITADAVNKQYGDADPTLTYQITSGSLVGSDTFTGSLARVAGESVGNYAINQGTVALNANYVLTYVSNNLTIGQRAIEITADAQSKTYGDADPTLTYQITAGSLAGSDAFIGILERVVGENIGTYAITQGTLGINSNYAISLVSNDLEITTRALEVTADAQTKIYGDGDPALTYQITNGSLAFSDAFTGALDRVTGQAQGNYAINQGTLSLGANYDLTFVPGNLFIDYRFIRVIPAAPISKTYGDADPDLTWPYIITQGSLAFDDTLETYGTFRSPGENIGRYQIRGLSARFTSTNGGESSYAITYTNAGSVSLDITTRAIEVTADIQAKTYGDTDPALSYQITNGALQFTDTFTGALSRATGENIGNYAINQATLSAGSNYTMTYIGNDFTIGQRAIEITADDLVKVIGSADPALTYQITSGGLQFSDVVTGSLSRVAGETLGNYVVNQGTLNAGSNYNLTFVPGNLTITNLIPQAITFGPLADRIFGDADFALTATGGASGDPVTFVSSNPSVATISGNTVTIIGAGTTTITASQAGNATYAAAIDVQQILTVNKGDQTITFASLANVSEDDADFNLNATASSGLAVTYISSDPSVATVSGNTVSIIGLGTTTITASQTGDSNWNAATDVMQTLTVVEACPLVNIVANNFQIQTSSETCDGKNNGIITISTVETLNYIATINNQTYAFSSTLVVPDLSPGDYNVCITVDGFSSCEQCFELAIDQAPVLSGKTTINEDSINKQVLVEIESGTAPYTVTINNEVVGEYTTNSFLVDVKNGDVLDIHSSVTCQGKLSTTIGTLGTISAYPNPTRGNVTLLLPGTTEDTIAIDIYNAIGMQVSSGIYSVVGNKVTLPMENLTAGVYFASMNTSTSKIIKIIKE
ncbi:MBG domain-containing protein [Aquimarina sp. 2304DJ70-9]|uniref:MBG domain-containing protein n=1 Tax=Aquimarina penaris TaxID=3231044 RepID=UPI003462BE28